MERLKDVECATSRTLEGLMDTPGRAHDEEQWERAVSGRLAKLRSMPVDTSRLERALRAEIPPPAPARGATAWFWLRPVRTIAASFLVLATLVAILFLSTSSGPVLASPARMAKLHEDLVSGKIPVVQVESIKQANQVLSSQWRNSPEVPSVPEDHVMACCMKSVKDKKVACVLMKREGVTVSMMVAHSPDVRLPDAAVTVRNGISYRVQSSGRLNMVMTERQGRWVCLIGELPAERLMDIADGLQF